MTSPADRPPGWEHQPVAWRDQYDAAAADAERVQRRTADLIGRPVMHHTETTGSPTLDRLLAAWRDLDTAGRLAVACPHGGQAPRVLAGLLHRPGWLYCPACLSLVAHADAAARPTECDGCGRYASTFREVNLQTGPLMLTANVCRRCYPDDQP